ncbi:hypothetical protein ABGB09_29745 [Streptomyces sp. B8F3]
MARIPPDLIDRVRRLEEEVRELRGRINPPADDTRAETDARRPGEDDE